MADRANQTERAAAGHAPQNQAAPEGAHESLQIFELEAADEQWMSRLRDAIDAAPLGVLGSYELLTEVSRGGQGVVYCARRRNDARTVALKRLLTGAFASLESRRRFEREVEAAAALDHPGIVSTLGVEVAEGQPLLAMEWIDGIPINEWAEGEAGCRRDVDTVVRMMLRVCEAIHHAHQRGVIHRDLKPSNILIDAADQPHVLDFGLARIVAPDARPGLAMTVSDQFIGTPMYAAPEQFSGNELTDVRSDVYSLGVIAFEMLTGRLPHPSTGDWSTIVDAVRNVDPVRPSMLASGVRRELDAIVLKALARDKIRRYQSVEALAADLQRYADGEPVLANPPGAFYELSRLARRHRGLFVFLGTVFALITIGGVIATVLAVRLAQQQRISHEAQQQEREARVAAERISAFLQQTIASLNPATSGSSELTVREMLDDAAARVATELTDQPQLAASIRSVIGQGYQSLGIYDEAEAHFTAALQDWRRSVEGDDPNLASSLGDLAKLQYLRARYDAAERLCQEALAMQRRLLGDEHPQIARNLVLLGGIVRGRAEYATAESLYQQAIAMQRPLLGDLHADLASSLNDYATLLSVLGRHGEAERMHREVLAMRRALFQDPHPEIIKSRFNLGVTLGDTERYDEALSIYQDILGQSRQIYGEKHPTVATVLDGLGEVLSNSGRPDQAIPILREALAIRRASLGDEHPHTAVTLNNLGLALRDTGDLAGAQQVFQDSLAIRRTTLGDKHPFVGTALSSLASVQALSGDRSAAEAAYTEALAIFEAALGHDHPRALIVRKCLQRLRSGSEREGDS